MALGAPSAPIDIVNLGLLNLYQQPIASFTDGSVAASIANRTYDQTRRSLLRNFLWNFANARGVAALVNGSTPAFDFQTFYQMPNDCLRVRWIGYDWHRHCPLKYDIQGRYILLNPTSNVNNQAVTPWPSLYLKYTQDSTEIANWDPLFIDCLALQLAKKMCMPVTGDKDLYKQIDEDLRIALAEANAINHMERPTEVTEDSLVARARMVETDDFDLPINPSSWGAADDS